MSTSTTRFRRLVPRFPVVLGPELDAWCPITDPERQGVGEFFFGGGVVSRLAGILTPDGTRGCEPRIVEIGGSTLWGALLGAGLWIVLDRMAVRFIGRRRSTAPFTLVVATALGALGASRFGSSLASVTVVILMVGLVVLTEIDLRTRRLPREISYPLFVAAILTLAVAAVVEKDAHLLRDALLGAALATAILFVLHVSSRGGLGDGDVRLAPTLGTFGAFGGLEVVWTGLLVAFVAAGATVIVLVIFRRMGRHSTVAFGPFLAVGSVFTVLVNGTLS